MIEFLWGWIGQLLSDIGGFLSANYDPLWDTVDIALVLLAVYWLLSLIRGTRAVQIVVGFMALIATRLVADVLELTTTLWILDTFLGYGVFIIIVLFQPEIRRALARVGRGMFFGAAARQEFQHLEELVRAAQQMSERRTGALIVLERDTSLEDIVERGTALDANVSTELLTSVFHTTSPLHDGAVIVRDGRITHAGCILPLTLRQDLPDGLGTRHRAALGLAEETDAVVIVVSEETGAMSLVRSGEAAWNLEPPRLRELLHEIFVRGEGGPGEDNASEATARSEPADAQHSGVS